MRFECARALRWVLGLDKFTCTMQMQRVIVSAMVPPDSSANKGCARLVRRRIQWWIAELDARVLRATTHVAECREVTH